MAGPNEIQVGRFNRYVQKFLGIKGGPPMPTVSSDLHIVHEIESSIEGAYLQGWDAFFYSNSITGAAGQTEALELRNPVGSNVVCCIKRGFIEAGGASTAYCNQYHGASADQPTVAQVQAMDARQKRQSSLIVSHNNGGNYASPGATSTNFFINNLTASQSVESIRQGEDVLLMPGDAYLLFGSAVATQHLMGFYWWERFLEEPERV